jgi:hypothetical protein
VGLDSECTFFRAEDFPEDFPFRPPLVRIFARFEEVIGASGASLVDAVDLARLAGVRAPVRLRPCLRGGAGDEGVFSLGAAPHAWWRGAPDELERTNLEHLQHVV